MRPRTTLREALSDPALLGHVLKGDSWLPWRVLLIAAMGEALTDDERSIFTQLTGRAREPLQPVKELEAVVGRRGGKTSAMAAGATYIAACCDHSDALARGETGVLLCVAQAPARGEEDSRLRRGQSPGQRNPAPAHQGPQRRTASS